MLNTKKHEQTDVPQRRRGRPTGQNRIPLSLEERRARNAFYERERRNAAADAMSELAQAVGCDQNISNADVMATAIFKIRDNAESKSGENLDDLRRINANLEAQIALLQERLGLDDASLEHLDSDESPVITSHSLSEFSSDSNDSTRMNQHSGQQMRKRKRPATSGHKRLSGKRAKPSSDSSDPEPSDVGLTSDITLDVLTENEKQLITRWLEEEVIAKTV